MTDARLAPHAVFLLRFALGAMFVAHSLILKLFVRHAAGHRRLLHPLSAPC